jgi:hypothetical protein
MIPVALLVHGGSIIMSFWAQGPIEWVVGNISFMGGLWSELGEPF